MVAGKIVVVLLVFYAVFANAIVATEHEDEILIAGRNHEKRVHVEEHALDVRKEAIKWLSTFFGEEFAQFYFDFFCTMSFFISYMACKFLLGPITYNSVPFQSAGSASSRDVLDRTRDALNAPIPRTSPSSLSKRLQFCANQLNKKWMFSHQQFFIFESNSNNVANIRIGLMLYDQEQSA